MTKKPKEQPVKTFRIGRITSALWKREVETEGTPKTRYSVKIQKSFKDPKSGEWQTYDMYLNPAELLVLAALAQKAYDYAVIQEDSNH